MFSQYSWWDFIKFCLMLAVPYYAYVLVRYYREDIREWISNLGQAPQATSTESPEEEEEVEDMGLYAVKTYSDNRVASEPAQPARKPEPAPRKEAVAVETIESTAQHDVDISDGVVLDDESGSTFEIALVADIVRPAERSLADVLNAARRVTADQQGTLSANDPDDTEASEVATLINQQKGFDSLLSGVSFNR